MFEHGLLTLHYGKHRACIQQELAAARRGAHPTDLTVICDSGIDFGSSRGDEHPDVIQRGRVEETRVVLQAHRLVLAAASPLIR